MHPHHVLVFPEFLPSGRVRLHDFFDRCDKDHEFEEPAQEQWHAIANFLNACSNCESSLAVHSAHCGFQVARLLFQDSGSHAVDHQPSASAPDANERSTTFKDSMVYVWHIELRNVLPKLANFWNKVHHARIFQWPHAT
jgi:hypothetical protein